MLTKGIYQVVVNSLSDGVYMVDSEKNLLLWNETAEKITGFSQQELQEQNNPMDLLDHLDRTGAPTRLNRCPIAATLEDGQQRLNEMFIRHKHGYRVPVMLKTMPVYAGDEIVGVVATFTDRSIRVQQEDLISSLTRLALTDPLTGLSNKRHIESVLESRLEEYRRFGIQFSVMYINLDDFALCNADYGYDTGNEMLVRLAEEFRQNYRGSDMVGRWGGEEFVGVFETVSQKQLRIISEKTREMVESCILHVKACDETVGVTASIGATMVGPDDSVEQIVDRAAALMHVSKISGKNCATIG